jgi:SWI/SNF-related matrix-associated actin-dependent regulator 1 of chromatin subfamily A
MGLLDKARAAAATPAAPAAPRKDLNLWSNAPTVAGPVVIDGLALTPMAHQEVVVDAVRNGFTQLLIADEMGVGKTLSAIAVIEDQDAYPALIVCPPSLTLNWQREVDRALPHRTVSVLSGSARVGVSPTDIVIVGDSAVVPQTLSVVHGRKDPVPDGPLVGHPWKALVVDEAHRLKTPNAKRTKAVSIIADAMAPDAVRLLMSGTPLINRPVELIPLLKILGALKPIAGDEWFYKRRYCDPQNNGWGTTYNGASYTLELSERLRSHVMIRRTRDEVLTLPNKGRNIVRAPLSTKAQRLYQRAVDDLVGFLRERTGNAHYELSAMAEAIVLLNALRAVAGQGKVDATVELAEDLIAQGEQVFIAAWHKDVVQELWKRLHKHGPVTITGGISTAEKQRSVDAFQSGRSPVLIGNIQAAGVGFTLTSGRHIIVAELPWTPGDLQQVEDRLHRIGQVREVISTVVVADVPGTASIDERLWALLDAKATVVNAVLDGKEEGLEIEGDSIINELLDSYR